MRYAVLLLPSSSCLVVLNTFILHPPYEVHIPQRIRSTFLNSFDAWVLRDLSWMPKASQSVSDSVSTTWIVVRSTGESSSTVATLFPCPHGLAHERSKMWSTCTQRAYWGLTSCLHATGPEERIVFSHYHYLMIYIKPKPSAWGFSLTEHDLSFLACAGLALAENVFPQSEASGHKMWFSWTVSDAKGRVRKRAGQLCL